MALPAFANAPAAGEALPRFANATAAFAAVVHCRAVGAGTAELRAMIADQRVRGVTRAFLAAQCGGADPPYPNAGRAFLAAYAGAAAGNVREQLASGDSTRRASGSAGLRVARASVALLGEAQRLCDEEAARRGAAKGAARLAAAGARLAAQERAAAELAAGAQGLAAAELAAAEQAAPRAAGFRARLDAYMAAMVVARAADVAALERRARLIGALRNVLVLQNRANDPTNVQHISERMVLQHRVAEAEAVQAEWAHELGLSHLAVPQ